MKNFEFKSQICTTREQSERLLALGLKKETADMVYITDGRVPEEYRHYDLIPEYYESCLEDIVHIPAWSLHRLIEILGPHRLPIHFRKKGRVDITISYINQGCSGRSGYNYYDSIIDCIEWLINEGYNHFNKDYLGEKK
jgi:hypothetical protein